MNAINCLSPERTLMGASASSKKRVFEIISELFAQSCEEVTEQDVLDSFFARERLGCTALGQGIAIPHGRIKCCNQIIAAIVLLEEGIDYEAKDKQPVDIFFALLVPEEAHNDHINCLSSFAKLLKQEAFCRQLRNAYNNQALYDIVVTALNKQENQHE